MATLRSARLKLKGLLSATRWNSRDELLEATLSVDDGAMYLVEAQRQRELVEEFMEEYVAVEGVLKSRGGKRFLEILSIEVAEEDNDSVWEGDSDGDEEDGYEQEYEEEEDDENLD